MEENKEFEKNVFINCPFDVDFLKLLRPWLFTLLYYDFNPRIALESLDSGEMRLDKIIKLIKESKYGIHDLSRIKASKKGEYYRLNMPFEIGLDLGCKFFGQDLCKNKKVLILEREKYSYQKGLSDLAGADIKCHEDDPETLISNLRSWFAEVGFKNLDSSSKVWYSYNYFYLDFYDAKKKVKFTDKEIEELPIPEFIDIMKNWILENRNIESDED